MVLLQTRIRELDATVTKHSKLVDALDKMITLEGWRNSDNIPVLEATIKAAKDFDAAWEKFRAAEKLWFVDGIRDGFVRRYDQPYLPGEPQSGGGPLFSVESWETWTPEGGAV